MKKNFYIKIIIAIIFCFININLYNTNVYATSVQNEEIKVGENMKILSNVYDNLNSDEKQLVEDLKSFVSIINDCNIDNIIDNIDISNKSQIKKDISSKINDFNDLQDLLNKIFKKADFKILDINKKNNKYEVKLNISLIDIEKVIKKIAPAFIAKNLFKLMKGANGIDEELINSLITQLSKGINDKTELSSFDYSINMRQQDDKYVLTDTDKIVHDVQNLLSGFMANLKK